MKPDKDEDLLGSSRVSASAKYRNYKLHNSNIISGRRKTWKSVVYRLSIPYVKELGPEVFWILEYLHIHAISCRWD